MLFVVSVSSREDWDIRLKDLSWAAKKNAGALGGAGGKVFGSSVEANAASKKDATVIIQI